MMRREPPAFAMWLLRQWGSPYHGDSLAGDLIEQFQEGRTRAWCWRQVAAAILIARWRFVRTMIKALMLVFGLIALGVGTLTWADTTRRDACHNPARICPNN